MAVVAIYKATAKKLEFASGKSGMATLFKVIMGKHGFNNGEKYENFEISFLARIIYHNISMCVHSIPKDAELQHLGGYIF